MSLRSIPAWRENQQQPDLCEAGARSSALAKARAWIERPAPSEAWLCRAGPLAKIGHVVVSGTEGRDSPRFASVPAAANLVSSSRAGLPTTLLVTRFGRSDDKTDNRLEGQAPPSRVIRGVHLHPVAP